MFRTVEALIDEKGVVRLLEPIQPGAIRRALVTIIENEVDSHDSETAILSEPALSDWNCPEEDEAWAYLQQAP